MAFDIGQRVTSTFTGPGVVTGELEKDTDVDCKGKTVITSYQMVRFDSAMIGERLWEIKKLSPVDEVS